jgi:ribonuclease HI
VTSAAQGVQSRRCGGTIAFEFPIRVLKQEEFERPGFTSNEGEIRGLIAALGLAQKDDVIVVDSMNALFWLMNGKSSSRPDLNPILAAAKKLAQEKKAAIKNMQSLDNAEIVIEWRGRDVNEAGKFNEAFH